VSPKKTRSSGYNVFAGEVSVVSLQQFNDFSRKKEDGREEKE